LSHYWDGPNYKEVVTRVASLYITSTFKAKILSHPPRHDDQVQGIFCSTLMDAISAKLN